MSRRNTGHRSWWLLVAENIGRDAVSNACILHWRVNGFAYRVEDVLLAVTERSFHSPETLTDGSCPVAILIRPQPRKCVAVSAVPNKVRNRTCQLVVN